jgi:catechol 2,3-dioxygenase-like lactoylglutathione lyase family enzyme
MSRSSFIRMVRHAGIVVENLNRETAFYCDVLGLKEHSRMEESGPFIETLIGQKGARLTTVKLSALSGGTLIELIKFHMPETDPRPIISVKTLGLTHIALTVVDLRNLKSEMEASGAVFINEPLISPDGRVLAAYCRDPENNLLELVEEL